jgi:hypothetical protein
MDLQASEARASHTFFRVQPRNGRRGATNEHESGVHSCIAATPATRSQTKIVFMCADRLYFTPWTLKIKLEAHDPVKTG